MNNLTISQELYYSGYDINALQKAKTRLDEFVATAVSKGGNEITIRAAFKANVQRLAMADGWRLSQSQLTSLCGRRHRLRVVAI